MAGISPLHRIIGSGRWAASRLLGRLVILAHAAFLDAGFLSASDDVRFPVGAFPPLSLPLWYTAPQLLHRPDAAAVALRLVAHGRHLIFYVCIKFRDPWLDTYWFCLDALAVAPLLSGGLDDTVRALSRDARAAALWSALTDRLSRRVLVDLCAKNGVALEPEPSFMSLTGDLQAAILARLAGSEDLARMECTCKELREFIENRDATLWKAWYDKITFWHHVFVRGDADADGDKTTTTTTEVSWKKRYMAARRPSSPNCFIIGIMPVRETIPIPVPGLIVSDQWWPPIFWIDGRFRKDSSGSPSPLPEEMTAPRRRRRRRRRMWRAIMHRDDACGHGHKKKQRHGPGAVHSPSSRFRWNHR